VEVPYPGVAGTKKSGRELHFPPSRHQTRRRSGIFDLPGYGHHTCFRQEHKPSLAQREQKRAFVIRNSRLGDGERGEFCRFSRFSLFCNEPDGVRTTLRSSPLPR
jgi:hypothetical protein